VDVRKTIKELRHARDYIDDVIAILESLRWQLNAPKNNRGTERSDGGERTGSDDGSSKLSMNKTNGIQRARRKESDSLSKQRSLR
jgi:hypothetical protein